MPEPPTCVTDGFPHERTAPHACLIHARNYHANSKRLKDAECEREWEAFEQDAFTALLLHALGDERVPAWRFKRFNHGANTWRRFATHPHALEEA